MTRIENIDLKKRLTLIVLIGLILLGIVLYAYFLNQTIINSIYVEKSEKQLSDLNVTVGELEAEYFKAKNNVTLYLAKDLGFADAGPQLYISRKKEAQTLSFKNESH
jgi:hypothetical protein